MLVLLNIFRNVFNEFFMFSAFNLLTWPGLLVVVDVDNDFDSNQSKVPKIKLQKANKIVIIIEMFLQNLVVICA